MQVKNFQTNWEILENMEMKLSKFGTNWENKLRDSIKKFYDIENKLSNCVTNYNN